MKLKVTHQNGCTDSLKKNIAVQLQFDNALLINSDTTICPGDSVQIKKSAQVISQCWESSVDGALQTVAEYVKPTTTTTYTLTSDVRGTNLVKNPEFTNGNLDFISAYQYANTNTTGQQYWVGNNPALWNNAFSACGDHSSGVGNMLIVSSSAEPNKTIWSQRVDVVPNTNYQFSAWVQSLSGSSSNLHFSINGVRIGKEIFTENTACQWKQFSTIWNAGTHTNVLVGIETNSDGNLVHPTAIDDVFFGTIATLYDSVRVQVGDACDSIRISGMQKICSASDTITYAVYTPGNCNTQYVLEYDTNTVDIVSKNNSAFSVVFKRNGQTRLKVVLPNNCKLVADSIDIDVKISPKQITLGPDLAVCRDTSFLINFGGGFDSYLWQDGSTDSVLLATSLGLYHVQATNFCGEVFKDSLLLSRRVLSPFSFNPKNIEACVGDSVQLSASGGDAYSWTPSVNFSTPGAAFTKALVSQTTSFTLSISDTVCGRDTLITIPVRSNELPRIQLLKSNDVNCTNDSAVLSATGGIRYAWQPNVFVSRTTNNSITVKPQQTTTYSVTAEDANGCRNKDSVTVLFTKEGEQRLFVPSAFTPNNDGINDVFKPVFIGAAPKYSFSIFNRWGQLLFKTNNPSTGWDGRFGPTLQPGGVFVYYITAEGVCGGLFERKGTFVLIR